MVLVLVVLLAAAASLRFDLGTRWFGWDYPSPVDEPAAVAPPPGLDVPEANPAPRVAQALPRRSGQAAGDLDAAALRRRLAPFVHRPALGPRVGVEVAGLNASEEADGSEGSQAGDAPDPAYRSGPARITPASTMKLLTATAALASLGADHRFRTTARSVPGSRRVVLVGGGDPLLASKPPKSEVYPARADTATLASATAEALKSQGRTTVRLSYDASLFAGPQVSPAWPAHYVPENVVTPITALWVDQGLDPNGYGRVRHPARVAARTFAEALRRQGIRVRGAVHPRKARPASVELAAVESAPLGEIVQRVLEVSDNEGAEVLAHQVAVAEGEKATYAGGSRAVRSVLGRLGIDTSADRILDGSGLSRRDRLTPETLVSVLRTVAAADHPALRAVATGLPVAGFTGSLDDRFDGGDPAGRGRVRAKTGTLTGVHGLAGYVTDTDGDVMVLVAVADRVRAGAALKARSTLDRLAAALAGCACAADPGGAT